jgi:hypothetical protein
MRKPGTFYILAYGELHYETRAGYMRTLGPAVRCADGAVWITRGNYWIPAELVR